MSSKSLSFEKCYLKRNVQNSSQTISLKGMKYFSWITYYKFHINNQSVFC